MSTILKGIGDDVIAIIENDAIQEELNAACAKVTEYYIARIPPAPPRDETLVSVPRYLLQDALVDVQQMQSDGEATRYYRESERAWRQTVIDEIRAILNL